MHIEHEIRHILGCTVKCYVLWAVSQMAGQTFPIGGTRIHSRAILML